MKIFQERLIEQRKLNAVTQRQMADFLNIAQPSYIRYENGSSEPSLACLVKIADYFDVSVDYLLGRAEFWTKAQANDLSIKTRKVVFFVRLKERDYSARLFFNHNTPLVINGDKISQSAESAISVYTITEPAVLAPENTEDTRLKLKKPNKPQLSAPTITKI